jgi:uncharacterized membrane protein
MEILHVVNITTHVIAGTIALLTGLAALSVKKGGKSHLLFGRVFTWMMVIVIVTGLTGVFAFKRNTFLLVLTLLSGYNCFSGIRAVRLGGKKPGGIDYAAPLVVMAAAVYYLYYIRSIGLYWSPVVIYSTIGALFLVTVYDLFKALMPVMLLKRTVIYEHIYKMVSALSGLASAFTGTVFPDHKPYSQFLPSVLGLLCIIVIFIRVSNKPLSLKRNPILHQAN